MLTDIGFARCKEFYYLSLCEPHGVQIRIQLHLYRDRLVGLVQYNLGVAFLIFFLHNILYGKYIILC